ncbi:unnamed protein product, partial [Laminaria digitata]
TQHTLLYLKYFGVLYCSYFEYSQYQKYSKYAQYTRSMSCTPTVSAPFRQFRPLFRQNNMLDGPTSARWSKLLSWGATGVLRVP